MDGHGNINSKWVLHILIESPTYIQLIISKKIMNVFFSINLNSHKIVVLFFYHL
jgi:hypothetical protein